MSCVEEGTFIEPFPEDSDDDPDYFPNEEEASDAETKRWSITRMML